MSKPKKKRGKKRQKFHTAKNSGVDASTEPPNQTANLWIGWLSTLTSTGCDWAPNKQNEKSKWPTKNNKYINYNG